MTTSAPEPAQKAVLALDQGSHASRACLIDAHGVLRDQRSIAVATRRHDDGRVEQDPLELLASLREAIVGLCAAHPRTHWQTAGLATQRSTLLCCDRRTLEPLTQALSWQDRRNAAWLASFAPRAARIRAITGLPLSPHYGAGKLRWCLDHDARVRSAARSGTLLALPLSAWLTAQLTGTEPRVDPANASRTLLFDSANLDWSDELLTLFGIERRWLPLCGPTRGMFGTLRVADWRGHAANETAANCTIALRAVSGDQSVVPFGFGEIDDTTLYLNLGTGAFLQRALNERPAHPEPLLGSVLMADATQRRYSLEGTVNGAGSAIALFCAQEHSDEAALWSAFEALPRQGRDSQPLATEQAATTPVFINTVGGLGSPWWREELAGGFLGAEDRDASPAAAADTSRLGRFAAVVESIAFLIAANARELARYGPLARVRVAGGLARSDGLCRRLASLLSIPVLRGELEISARGCAAVAAPELALTWTSDSVACFEPDADPALAARERLFGAELTRRLRNPRH